MKLKIISIILILVLVVNLTLFVLKRINQITFWITIGVIALVAYKGTPYLKKKRKN